MPTVCRELARFLYLGPRPDRHDKISSRRRADILDAVFVIGMNESDRAWAHHMAGAIDRELDRTLPNKPHFAMQVVMRGVGHPTRRQGGFVHLQ